jgi:hypothetical protein
MGYRASNARDRDAEDEWRSLPLSERLRRVDWRMALLAALFAAPVVVPVWRWLS